MKKLLLPILLVLLLLMAAVCAHATPTTLTNAVVKAADPMLSAAKAVPPFRDGSIIAAVPAMVTLAALQEGPTTAMDTRTGAYNLPTYEVAAYKSPPTNVGCPSLLLPKLSLRT